MISIKPFNYLLILVICACSAHPGWAATGKILPGGSLSSTELAAIVENCKADMPMLWEAMTDVRSQQVDITITDENVRGPGKASGKSRIILNARFVKGKLPAFPEDRLIVVLYHEFGHLVLNRQTSRKDRNPVKHEHFAFGYSLQKAKQLAEQGKPGPLEQVVKNLKLRSKNGKPKDPHTVAIRQLMGEDLWRECCRLLETVNKN